MKSRKCTSKLLAGLTAFTLIAGACGSDDNDSKSTGATGPIVAATTTSVAGSSGSTTATAGASTTAAGASTTSGSATAGGSGDAGSDDANHHVGDEGTPVKGGTLVYGIDADTANPWAPYRASLTNASYIPIRAISDTLFSLNEAGETVPLLVEKVEHNPEFTEWTMHLRSGIKFHDGTPFDGNALKFNMETWLYSPLSGAALTPIEKVTASGQDVTITTRGGGWTALTSYFIAGFHLMSPQWLASLPDVPHRTAGSPVYDAALAATPASGDPAKPVGLGAFKFESYTPGNGNSFKAVRNPDYWRGPNGITGEDLPYLDAIEAVVYVDVDSRSNAVRAGDIDVMHTANADTVRRFLDDRAMETISSNKYAEVSYILLNTASGPVSDPEGKNANSPLLTLACRQALAAAVDLERLKQERGGGLTAVSNGPFPQGSVGYLEDTGYPKYDVAQAQKYMDACLAERGTGSIEFSFDTSNDPFNIETVQLIRSMWTDAFGDKIKVSSAPIEQGQIIGLALFGTYQAMTWRNHGGFDPDHQRLWWQSASSAPIGQQALNFGRFKDPVIDEALATAKSNPDIAARRAAAETINKQFGSQVYNIWLNHAVWGIVEQPYVNGVEASRLPDGSKAVGLAGAGAHGVNQLWCDDGKCE